MPASADTLSVVVDHAAPNPGERAARHADAVPRVLPFVTIKRIDPRFPSTWGHWWIEVDDQESYGWWPLPCPLGLRRALTGTRGTINGLGARTDGTPTRDPYHGDEPDHCFHPTLVVAKSDDQVRADIRAFASNYVGAWHYQWWWLPRPPQNCRYFQWELFDAVGLVEEPEYLYTHGPGCPFMYPLRSATWRAQDIIAAVFMRARTALRGRRRLESTQAEVASD